VNAADAKTLIATAVNGHKGVWADFGAGSGTFTRALAALLGPDSRVYAVDRDPKAVASLSRLSNVNANVVAVDGDFASASLELPGLHEPLDGILMANALHFVADPEGVLRRLVRRLRVGGRVVIIEYDRRAATAWVPHPIPVARWKQLAEAVGLSPPVLTETRPSTYSGILYVAAADRLT
jgi:SAM-dependent methyltransferase